MNTLLLIALIFQQMNIKETETEIRQECVTYNVLKKCTKCKTGLMEFNGQCLTSMPMQYGHTCNKCGHYERYIDVYPHFEHSVKK